MQTSLHRAVILSILTLLGTVGLLPAQSVADEARGHAPIASVTQTQEARDQENRKKLEAEMARQEFDRAASITAERQVSLALDEMLLEFEPGRVLGLQLVSVTCGTTFCRIELTYTDPMALSNVLFALPAKLGWGGMPRITKPTDFGAILCLDRQESKLPQPENKP
jgi:hypothetical protein